MRSPSIPCASSAKPSRRSSPRRATRRATRMEAIDVRYDALPSVVDASAAVAPGAPQVWPAATGNIAAEIRHGDVAAAAKAFADAAHVVTLDIFNQRLAPCPIEPRALHRELRRRERAHHAPRHQPDPDRPARRAVRRGARHRARQGAGARGRCRRRLRDEDRAVSGGRRAGVLHARTEAAAQVVRRAHRRVPGGLARSRRHQQGRAGAGRVRPRAGAPRGHARQPGRVRDARRRRDPAAHRAVGVDEHLRHPDDRHRDQGRPHAHEPDGRLPRRRAARGDLPHRAPDGRRGAQARHGSRPSFAGAT